MKQLTSIACLLALLMFVSCEKDTELPIPNGSIETNITNISWFGDSRKVQSYIGGKTTLYFSVNTNDGEIPNGQLDLANLSLYSGGIKTKALPVECEGLQVLEANYNLENQVLEVLVSVDINTSGYGETYLAYRDGIRSDGFEFHISNLKLEDFANEDLNIAFSEWIIVDEEATHEDFDALKDKLENMSSSVDLLFPFLEEVPRRALYYAENLSSISLPVATIIGEDAFYSEDINTLSELSLPMANEASILDGTIYPEEIDKINLTVGDNINVLDNSVVKVENGKIINKIGSFASITGGVSDSTLAPLYQEIAYSEISEDNYPDGDYWSITGCTMLENNNNISDALEDANDKGRKISILINDLTTLGDWGLRGTFPSALSSISLPNATTIGNGAFEFCRNLESVYLPEVTSIGDYVFHACERLNVVSLPKVESIGISPFSVTGPLTELELNPNKYSLADGVVYNKDLTTIIGAYNIAENYTAPSTVTTISELSFLFCREVKTLSFPSVETVGDRAFSDCISLTSLSIPQVVTLGDDAMGDCPSLEIIELNPTYFTFEDAILYNKDKSTIIKALKISNYYESPASVTTIGRGAFKGLTSGSIIILPEVTTIESQAFEGCESLAIFYAPKLKTLGDSSLRWCDLLESVELPELVTVGKEAFSSCWGLIEISLPKVTHVGSKAFYWSGELETVELPSAVLIEEDAFLLARAITSLEVASAAGVTYSQSTEDWGIRDKTNITLTTNSINQAVFSTWDFNEVVLKED